MTQHRPDPEALLARAKEEEARKAQGRLKLFFGAAAGVGKTFAMERGDESRVWIVVGGLGSMAIGIALIPLSLKGVRYRPLGAGPLLRRNLWIYGVGGVLIPFPGIKLIDMILVALRWV